MDGWYSETVKREKNIYVSWIIMTMQTGKKKKGARMTENRDTF